MNPKIQKMSTEIEKTRIKITELKARMVELEQQKTNAENTEIVAIFRSINLPLSELSTFVKVYKEQAIAPATNILAEPLVASPTSSYSFDSNEEEQDEN